MLKRPCFGWCGTGQSYPRRGTEVFTTTPLFCRSPGTTVPFAKRRTSRPSWKACRGTTVKKKLPGERCSSINPPHGRRALPKGHKGRHTADKKELKREVDKLLRKVGLK